MKKTALTLTAMALLAGCAIMAMGACDKIEEAIATCQDPCTKVKDCSATPPSGSIPGFNVPKTGNGAVDCAVNCAQADTRAMNGYSDCQLTCINDSTCANIGQCWDTKSDLYAKECLAKRAGGTPPAVTPPATKPSNNTASGNAQADDIQKDPAVQAAVEKGGGNGGKFTVNQGSTPPLIKGEYAVTGSIDDELNARAKGTTIDTTICFTNPTAKSDGTYVTYCEKNVDGISTAPITGADGKFTAYFVFPGAATILFSGTADASGAAATDVSALVVYASGVDVWEHSVTNWATSNADCTCPL
jgi:hypothetical protein